MLKKLSYQLSAPMPNVASNAGNDDSGSGVAQGSGLPRSFEFLEALVTLVFLMQMST